MNSEINSIRWDAVDQIKGLKLDYDEEYLIYDSIHPFKNITYAIFVRHLKFVLYWGLGTDAVAAQNTYHGCVQMKNHKIRCEFI